MSMNNYGADPTFDFTELARAEVRRGQEPKGSPLVRFLMVLLGALLVAAAVVLGRETWRVMVDPQASSWVQPVVDIFATPALESWMVWAGVGSIVVGLVCVVAALRPRPRTHVELQMVAAGATDAADAADAAPSTWLRHVDIARRCSALARTVPGVNAARTISGKKRVTVTVNTDAQDSEVVERVRELVGPELANLAHSPQLEVVAEHIEEVDSNV